MYKKSDLSQYTDEYTKWVERKLRNKFMVCLKGKSPQEVWDEEMEKYANKKHADARGMIEVDLAVESVLLQG